MKRILALAFMVGCATGPKTPDDAVEYQPPSVRTEDHNYNNYAVISNRSPVEIMVTLDCNILGTVRGIVVKPYGRNSFFVDANDRCVLKTWYILQNNKYVSP